MVVFLNLLLPILILIICWIGSSKLKKAADDKTKIFVIVKTIFAIVITVVTYSMVQPSYMPKGKAPVMSKVPVEYTDAVIQDRLLKPRTEAEAQQKVDEMLTVRDEAKKILEDSKKKD